ncbi:DUF4238 domain-containing protein [Bradyrhizobium sp. Arg62]|uniref:DUF4238 domain-containing protein n=1 Tax=Bradyrhizobium brasilense TaxID=1419277 RepID=UPI001E2DCADF|nr:DUF4238 domain-containing protein [Bradyrhizobium brasilense]MCC8948209.1 DUF4238 domain-containing protein [Bradyrhizobium brasilense]
MSNTTRRQHYVWKHYLRSWERAGRVSVLRKGGSPPFQTDAVNIAVMRDFYRLPTLSEHDEDFVGRFIDNICAKSPMLKELNRGWLDAIAMASRLRRLMPGFANLDPAIQGQINAEIERFEIQAEEGYHGAVEVSALPLIDALKAGKVEVWDNDDNARDLAYFMSVQHFRTKKVRDNVIAGYPAGEHRERVERLWPVLRHVFATNVGWSLFSERASWRLRLLRAPENAEFITGDQPTMNLLPHDHHNGLAFYYPVSPVMAAILEHRDNESVAGVDDDASESLVQSLNTQIFEGSHEQVFSSDIVYLEALAAAKDDPELE